MHLKGHYTDRSPHGQVLFAARLAEKGYVNVRTAPAEPPRPSDAAAAMSRRLGVKRPLNRPSGRAPGGPQMTFSTFSRTALSSCVAVALLAGCAVLREAEDDTPPIGGMPNSSAFIAASQQVAGDTALSNQKLYVADFNRNVVTTYRMDGR